MTQGLDGLYPLPSAIAITTARLIMMSIIQYPKSMILLQLERALRALGGVYYIRGMLSTLSHVLLFSV